MSIVIVSLVDTIRKLPVDAAQKNRILKRFLKEKSTTPADVNLDDPGLVPYAAMDRLLDSIVLNNNGLFDFATFEADENKWKEFSKIIDFSCKFTAGSPPTLTKIDEKSTNIALRYFQNSRVIEALPKDNYYGRATATPAADVELNDRIAGSRAKLYALIQTFPGATVFNPTVNAEVTSRISAIEALIKPLLDSDPQKAILQKRLTILTDLSKINQLKAISIPQDNGPALAYCTLAEATGGVTEKVALISLAKVKLQLGNLSGNDALTVDNYNDNRGNYSLGTEAILKLPKHGKVVEVQREAMALNISRMMGLDTARSTTVSYDGHPALFVPFDRIKQLSEFSSGKTFTAGLGIKGQTYTHYSTIKPVGGGMQSDRFVNDFGNSLGLFYLCSDTDAVGGYCQNKALRNANTLFIFDQVVMSDHKFVLDSRLSLQPDQFLMKHTRHGQGRNRTLIEDSSMVTKFESIMQLKDMSDRILQYASHTAFKHSNKAKEIRQSLTGRITEEQRVKLNTELTDVVKLEEDALLLKAKMQERVASIDGVLPKTTGVVSREEVRQALILEKLMHNPVLFSDDGRPYKNPWTNRQDNPALSINDLGNGSVQINFKSKMTAEMVDFIKAHGGGASLTLTSPKVLTISKAHLSALREDMLHPENTLALAPATDYLAPADLSVIKKAYDSGHKTRIIECIGIYRAEMNKAVTPVNEKLAWIKDTEIMLKEYVDTAKDQGFGMHILKKFYFDAQQQMQRLMNPLHVPAQLNQAFAAALKLDRVAEFNAVVREAIAQKKLTDPQFTAFLTYCIQREAAATNHAEAKQESLAVSLEAQRVIGQLKIVVPLAIQLAGDVPDGLIHVDPLADLRRDLDDEMRVLVEEPVVIAPTRPVVIDEPLQEGIKVQNT